MGFSTCYYSSDTVAYNETKNRVIVFLSSCKLILLDHITYQNEVSGFFQGDFKNLLIPPCKTGEKQLQTHGKVSYHTESIWGVIDKVK